MSLAASGSPRVEPGAAVVRVAMNLGQLSLTDGDREAMLEAIGVASVDELFQDIPAGVRLGRELDL